MIRGVSRLLARTAFSRSAALVATPKANLNQVQNMLEENLKYDAQKFNDEVTVLQKTDRIYKPTYTIEFDRTGEILVYSCDPFKHSTIYFKYPYILYEATIPLGIWAWLYNVQHQ